MTRWLTLVGILGLGVPASAWGQGAPAGISLAGRESVEQMKKFDAFIGFWKRIESPPGTRIPEAPGGCTFTRTNHGMTVDAACGPPGDPAEASRIFWQPVDRRFVFRLYSIRNPVDLLFEGEYEFPAPSVLRRTYRGYYGDGRIHLYRETWTLESADRMIQKTEHLKGGEWVQIFGGSAYRRSSPADSPEAKGS